MTDSRGFSLVSVVVTAVIAAIIFLAISQQLTQMSRAAKSTRQLAQLSNYSLTLQTILSQPAACSGSLAGSSFKGSGVTTFPVTLWSVVDDGASYRVVSEWGDLRQATRSGNSLSVPGWGLTAAFAPAANTVTYSNGTVWTRRASAGLNGSSSPVGPYSWTGLPTIVIPRQGLKLLYKDQSIDDATVTKLEFSPAVSLTSDLPVGTQSLLSTITLEVTRNLGSKMARPSTHAFLISVIVNTNATGTSYIIGCTWPPA